MANRSIFQQPFASNRLPGDVFMIDRSTNTLKLDESQMAPAIRTAQVVLSSAQVLALNTTPVLIVPASDAGTVNIPISGLIEFSGGSANYTTNTTITIGDTATISDTEYSLEGSIADRTFPNFLRPPALLPPSSTSDGGSLSVRAFTGNPAAGDSVVTVTVKYYNFVI